MQQRQDCRRRVTIHFWMCGSRPIGVTNRAFNHSFKWIALFASNFIVQYRDIIFLAETTARIRNYVTSGMQWSHWIGFASSPTALRCKSLFLASPAEFNITVRLLPSTFALRFTCLGHCWLSLGTLQFVVAMQYVKWLKVSIPLQCYQRCHLPMTNSTHNWGYLFSRYDPRGVCRILATQVCFTAWEWNCTY